jgi:ABC-type Na+ efflux pump permease subunit
MNLQSAWAVAAKDFKIFKKKSTVIYITIAFPLAVGIAFPLILQYALHNAKNHLVGGLGITGLMDAFSVWFLIGVAVIPAAIASYSLVGEKVQKSLEPLLATPMSDGEILLGKTISGLVVPLASIYAGSAIFMVLMDLVTHSTLGYWGNPACGDSHMPRQRLTKHHYLVQTKRCAISTTTGNGNCISLLWIVHCF